MKEITSIAEVCHLLERWAPRSLQESYDNAGLICGDPSSRVTGVLCTLDCTEAVVAEAVERGVNLIVAHHPIVFSGLKQLTGRSYVERTVIQAIKNDIAIYAIHTNLDSVLSGVNHKIAEKLGLHSLRILRPKNDLLKLQVFVPSESVDRVKAAMFDAGAGRIGAYEHCSFDSQGTGHFKPKEGANPTVGEVGSVHAEPETKVEVIVPAHLQPPIVRAMIDAHPYEVPAYELLVTNNRDPEIGSGMIGELEHPLNPKEFLAHVATQFGLQCIRHTAYDGQVIERVAICGGSGSFLRSEAAAQGAHAFVTSDMKYHEFFDAEDQLMYLDIGHHESEQFTPELIAEYLEDKNVTFAVLLSEVKTNPVHYFIS